VTMHDYIAVDTLSVGDELAPQTYDPVTKVQLVRYAGASGDFNPLHTDDSVAQAAGLEGVIAQGLLVMGFAGQAIARWFPVRSLKRFEVRFQGMTFPDDVITIKAEVVDMEKQNRIVCDVRAVDQDGTVKLAGQFEIL